MIHALALVLGAIGGPLQPGTFANLPLPAAESSAVAHSPDVAAADARVKESAAALSAARGSFGPALSASYTRSPQAGSAGQSIVQHFTTVGAQTSIGDLLNYSPAVSTAAANLRSAEFDRAAAQRSEQSKLIGLYYDALRAVATAQTRSAALLAAQADRNAAQIRFNAGDAPRLDVVRAQVAVARATADNERANAAQANALEALAIETGHPVVELGSVIGGDSTRRVPPLPDTPERAVAMALVRRPEIASARSAVAAQAAAVQSAERSIFPTITVSAGYTHGVDSGFNVAGPSATAQLTFPLSNASSARANAERAKLAEVHARLDALQRQTSLEVAAAMRTYAADERALQAAQEARRQAQAELDAVTLGYRSGASSSLEVTAARQTYVQAELDELSALYAQAQARANLELLLGS